MGIKGLNILRESKAYFKNFIRERKLIMGLTYNKERKATTNAAPAAEVKVEAEKVVAEAAVTEAPVEEGILGSKSNTIEFIAPLGDPSHPDVTKDKNGNTQTTAYIVGYRVKFLEATEIPWCGIGDDARKNIMTYVDKNGRKTVQAGEVVDLTRFELALLLAQPEYNTRITGGDKGFTIVYQIKSMKSANGTLAKASAGSEIPTAALKSDTGSIKDYQIIDILSYEVVQEDKVTRKIRKINPGFERWEGYCKVAQAKPRTASSRGSGNKAQRNKNAAAFLDIVAKKA